MDPHTAHHFQGVEEWQQSCMVRALAWKRRRWWPQKPFQTATYLSSFSGETVHATCTIFTLQMTRRRKKRFFERLPVDFEDDAIHIVCGDFNLAFEPKLDSNSEHHRPDSSVAALRAWLGELNVIDAWRLHHPDDREFSGPRPRCNRLDYIFLSEALVSSGYQDSRYAVWDESDHKAHQVELTSWHHPTGPGFWRLPDWLLRIEQLRTDIQKEAQILLPVLQTSNNPGLVWKSWKRRMKGYLKKCQKRLKSEAASDLAQSRQQLEECAAAVARDGNDERAAIDLYFAKQRYCDSSEEWTELQRGIGFEQSVTEAEKNSSYFFRAPRYELRNTPFDSIKCNDGSISNDPVKITRGFQDHWGSIFGDPQYAQHEPTLDNRAQRRLLNSIEKKLKPEASEILESDLTSAEFAAAIRSMRSHSAPGPDGFTSAFFQIDPDLFGKILLTVFQYQRERGELLPHQRYASVALLFKKGDRTDPGNFRPITLIPVEVKVLSRVLTDRLKPFMASLIHPDQKGFIAGRSIHHQIILVRDLQQLVTIRHGKGVAAFLDFAKAYDRVNRDYLFKVMERQGFGEHFLAWIRLMYKGSMCSLMINGWAQDPLEPSRGVKQGDPLSPFLFALSLEPLGNLLRAERQLGIRIDEKLSIPAAFFADDTVLFAQDVSCLQDQLMIVDSYCAGSGAMLNQSKSVIMSLNNRRRAPVLEPLRSLQKGETVKYLGIPFGNADTSTQLATQLDKKLITRLQLWKGRARTLLGRRILVQALILSLLWYFTTTVNIPTRFIKRWQSLVTRYVLYNRVATGPGGINIVRSTFATQQRELDGIGVPVIASSIRRQRFLLLQQLVKMLHSHSESSDSVWYRPIAELLRLRYGHLSRPWSGDFLLQDPPRPPGWNETIFPLWWRNLFKDWKKLQWPSRNLLPYTRTKTLQHALFSPIWWNSSREFQVWNPHNSRFKPLGEGSIKFRRLCRALASKQIWCLGDCLDPLHRWPTFSHFFCKVCNELQPLLGSQIDMADIFVLYRQLTQIFKRVLPTPEAGGIRMVSRGVIPPTYGLLNEKGSRFFPDLRSEDWKKLLRPAEIVENHPMQVLGCPPALIHSTLAEIMWL